MMQYAFSKIILDRKTTNNWRQQIIEDNNTPNDKTLTELH